MEENQDLPDAMNRAMISTRKFGRIIAQENNINNFWAFRNATTIDNAKVDNEKLSCWWTLFPTNPLKCRVGQLFSGAGKFLHPLLLPSQHTFPSKIFTLGDNNHCL